MFDAYDPEVDFFRTHPDKLARLLNDLRTHHIDYTEDGLAVVGGQVNMQIGGVFTSAVGRHELVLQAIEDNDPEKEAWAREFIRQNGDVAARRGYVTEQFSADHNLIPTYGLNYVLDVLFYTTSKIASWYQGPFTTNWTPGATARSNWAGATSGPLATELADAKFDESGRQLATFGVAASAGAIATSAATTLTIATGESGISLYGSTLNDVSTVAYNATDKTLLAATRFSAAKTGLGAADIVYLSYSITATSS